MSHWISTHAAFILGALLAAGLLGLGYQISEGARAVKRMERTVTVKGLAEKEVPADVVIWPLSFQVASNEIDQLYADVERINREIIDFLKSNGVAREDITGATPAVNDLHANNYGDKSAIRFRYVGVSKLTVYSRNIASVRKAMDQIVELGKRGVAITGDQYSNQVQYLYTGLNNLKPQMIEEATANARVVAQKFASDSGSQLGKIKTARQGQFSISERDASTAHIKKVRVVSTVVYYLTD